jgi:predicted DNA-binding transcriptional regulator
MVSKDQALGALIFVVCAVVAIGYIIALFGATDVVKLSWLSRVPYQRLQFWLVAIPVLVGFVVVLAIGAWIGWTMATTPPPKPLEEIEAEEKAEEKVAEAKPEEKAEEKPAPTEKAETEKETKKRKSKTPATE